MRGSSTYYCRWCHWLPFVCLTSIFKVTLTCPLHCLLKLSSSIDLGLCLIHWMYNDIIHIIKNYFWFSLSSMFLETSSISLKLQKGIREGIRLGAWSILSSRLEALATSSLSYKAKTLESQAKQLHPLPNREETRGTERN